MARRGPPKMTSYNSQNGTGNLMTLFTHPKPYDEAVNGKKRKTSSPEPKGVINVEWVRQNISSMRKKLEQKPDDSDNEQEEERLNTIFNASDAQNDAAVAGVGMVMEDVMMQISQFTQSDGLGLGLVDEGPRVLPNTTKIPKDALKSAPNHDELSSEGSYPPDIHMNHNLGGVVPYQQPVRQYEKYQHRTQRVEWTSALHRKFMDALEKLGDRAVPKAICREMNEPNLTREKVASHLQKYRLSIQKKNPMYLRKGSASGSDLFSPRSTESGMEPVARPLPVSVPAPKEYVSVPLNHCSEADQVALRHATSSTPAKSNPPKPVALKVAVATQTEPRVDVACQTEPLTDG